MSLKQAPGSFRSVQGTNLLDTTSVTVLDYQSLLTPGATLIDYVGITPTLVQRFKLLSVGVTAYLGYYAQPAFPNPPYGKLGKVIMGLALLGGVQTGGVGGLPWVTGMLPLPSDPSLTATVWDPASDAMPPMSPTLPSNPAASMLAVAGSVSPPAPVALTEGQGLAVGLWLAPSLLGWITPLVADTQGLFVCNATYAINYDDGQS